MQLLIDRIRQIISISEDESALLKRLFKEKYLRKGDHFLAEGEICRSVAMIGTGLLRYYINDDGSDRTYYFGREGDFVCDYESFLPKVPSNKNIQALEDTTLYIVSSDGLQQIYREVQGGERLGRVAIEQVFVTVLRQLSSFYKDAPQVRYQRFLEAFFDISQRVPQYYIASYVGVKPQSLSRIRKRTATQH